MANPASIVRSDGSRVVVPRHPSWKSEILGLYIALKTDPMIMLLFPMFFASNWFYTWRESNCHVNDILSLKYIFSEFNDYNGALFNIRARSLNSFCYWASQMFGSIAIGSILDQERFSRRTRAFFGWIE